MYFLNADFYHCHTYILLTRRNLSFFTKKTTTFVIKPTSTGKMIKTIIFFVSNSPTAGIPLSKCDKRRRDRKIIRRRVVRTFTYYNSRTYYNNTRFGSCNLSIVRRQSVITICCTPVPGLPTDTARCLQSRTRSHNDRRCALSSSGQFRSRKQR